MINDLLKFQKDKLSFNKLVVSKMKLKEKFYYYSVIVFFVIISLLLFVVIKLNSYWLYLILFMLSIDIIMFIKKEKGFLFYLFKKSDESIINAINRHKKVNLKNKKFKKALYQLRKRKLLKHLKNEKINLYKNTNFLLSSLRHKQGVELAILVVLFTGITFVLSSLFSDVIKFILPIDKLIEIKKSIQTIDVEEIKKVLLLKKVIFLSIIAFSVYAFFSFIPYIFTRGYFDNKFKHTRELQILLENIYLKDKKQK